MPSINATEARSRLYKLLERAWGQIFVFGVCPTIEKEKHALRDEF